MGQVGSEGEGDILHWPAPPQQSQTAEHDQACVPPLGRGTEMGVPDTTGHSSSWLLRITVAKEEEEATTRGPHNFP